MWLAPLHGLRMPALDGTCIVDAVGERVPVVDGIPTLKRRPRASIELAELSSAIEIGGRAAVMRWVAQWGVGENLDITRLTRVFDPTIPSYHSFVKDWTACIGGRGHYFIVRWACPSHLVALSLLPLLCGGNVLDLACGVGHLPGLVACFSPRTNLHIADINLLHLQVAKAYFVPAASAACIDFDEPLPLPNSAFDTVIVSDALHYCEDQEGLLAEVMRVLKVGGELFIIHVHDPHCLAGEKVPGNPATRRQYLRWIRNVDPDATVLGAAEKTYIHRVAGGAEPHNALVEDWLSDAAGAYIMRVIKGGGVGRRPQRLRLNTKKHYLNPIYCDLPGSSSAKLSWPNDALRSEFEHTTLPPEISWKVVRSAAMRRQLIRMGVLVPDSMH